MRRELLSQLRAVATMLFSMVLLQVQIMGNCSDNIVVTGL